MSVESPYDGICKGGPWDGKFYRHWSSHFSLMKPALTGSSIFASPQTATVEAVQFGEYRYDGYGVWKWTPSHSSTDHPGGAK
jgi:hypothetical protein